MSLFFVPLSCVLSFFFFFNDTATTEIYTLSLHDALPISWRGQASLAAAAKQGYRGILSNGYYLDLGWPASRHYAVDPISGDAANLSPEEQKRILGGESCIWAEYVDAQNIDSRIWPRNASIAERLWSPADVRDPASMYARLDFVATRLEWLGLTHKTSYWQMHDSPPRM